MLEFRPCIRRHFCAVLSFSNGMAVLHGEQDRVVPIRFGERLFALAHDPKRMVIKRRQNDVDGKFCWK